MVAFIGDAYKLFCQQAVAKSIQFTFEHEDETLPVWIGLAKAPKGKMVKYVGKAVTVKLK